MLLAIIIRDSSGSGTNRTHLGVVRRSPLPLGQVAACRPSVLCLLTSLSPSSPRLPSLPAQADFRLGSFSGQNRTEQKRQEERLASLEVNKQPPSGEAEQISATTLDDQNPQIPFRFCQIPLPVEIPQPLKTGRDRRWMICHLGIARHALRACGSVQTTGTA